MTMATKPAHDKDVGQIYGTADGPAQIVEFRRRHPPYNAGECAEIPEPLASRLVAEGTAATVKVLRAPKDRMVPGAPVTKGAPPPPDSSGGTTDNSLLVR